MFINTSELLVGCWSITIDNSSEFSHYNFRVRLDKVSQSLRVSLKIVVKLFLIIIQVPDMLESLGP